MVNDRTGDNPDGTTDHGENRWVTVGGDANATAVASAPRAATPPENGAGVGSSRASGPTWPQPSARVPSGTPAPARRNDWRSRVTLLLVAALIGGVAGHFASGGNGTSQYTIRSSDNAPTGQILASGISIPTLVGRVAPAVVSIDVKTPLEEDEGTGMILTSAGLIVTNNHVIAAATTGGGTITVTRSGQSKAIKAVLVGTDPSEDVALIRAEGVSNLPTVTLGNSNKLATGDSVVAIGNALGLAAGTPTVTAGIVSALGRTVTASGETTSETLHNMIQTDAAINPGNSGGPLLDASGQVVGMNTAVAGTLPDGENAQNIGFAIPVAEIKTLLPSLIKGGTVSKSGGYLGIEITTMTKALARSYGFSTTKGALIVGVVTGSAAAKAGLEVGDIIVKIDGRPITSANQVTKAVHKHRAGQQVTVTVIRNGARVTVYPTLGTVPN
jgi:putative serine protease PepD